MGLWELLLSIKADTTVTSQRVEALENRVGELEDSYPQDLENRVKSLERTVDLLTARMVKQEKVSEYQGKQIEDIRSHSMKENLLINFDKTEASYKESAGENMIELIRHFMVTKLGIDRSVVDAMYIPVAHRIGFKKQQYTRAAIVKIPVAKDRELVMSRVGRLKNTQHFIAKQLTPKQRERKQLSIRVYKELKGDPNNNVKLIDDKLYLNGDVQTMLLQPATIREVFDPNDPPTVTLLKGTSITDGGSTFSGYAAKVKTQHEVRDAVMLAKHNPALAAATHLMYAYKLSNGKSNYHSDDDHGIGMKLIQHMETNNIQDTVLIVSRDCLEDFKHIGYRRIEHAIKVCQKAIESL